MADIPDLEAHGVTASVEPVTGACVCLSLRQEPVLTDQLLQ